MRGILLTRATDHLRSTSGNIHRFRQRQPGPQRVSIRCQPFYTIFHLPCYWGVCHDIHLYSRVHLHGRTHHSEGSGAIPGCHPPSEYRLFRQARGRRDYHTHYCGYKPNPRRHLGEDCTYADRPRNLLHSLHHWVRQVLETHTDSVIDGVRHRGYHGRWLQFHHQVQQEVPRSICVGW